MGRAAGWLPTIWAVLLGLLLLGPALGHGYVLTYDMVWVPDLALRPDFLGVGTALPRAVPSDAVVAVLDEVLPGMLLQKIVLVGALVGGGWGAARLVRTTGTVGRLVAVSLYLWNPFVVERLQMGHWPVLVGYAVLPWAVTAAQRTAAAGRLAPALPLLAVLGSLSAGAGLVTAAVVLAFALRRAAPRANVMVVVTLVAANAPWVVSGLLHASTARSDAAGARLFALNDAGLLPAPVAALGLGGVWNVEVLLPSREGVGAVVAVALLLVLVALGARPWSAATSRRDRVAYLGCWLLGWGLATLTWSAPAVVGWLAETVPGGGLLRDGSRLLALCAPTTVVVASHGARRLVGLVPPVPVARIGAAVAVVLLPVALMPDAAWGAAGRIDAVTYPAAYGEVARELAGLADERTGDLLVLPLTSYRAPSWNDGRKVLDPWGRYLSLDHVASDVLVVSETTIAGEDPRVEEAARALEAGSAPRRARALEELGIGVVLVDRSAGAAPPIAGRTLRPADDLELTVLGDPVVDSAPTGWAIGMALAWGAYVLVGTASVVLVTLRGRRTGDENRM